MQVSCTQENLRKGLGIVGRAIATRTTLPITNHVLISTDDSRLKLSATNLEIAVSCWIGTQVEEPGEIAVPAGLLTDFVNSLPKDKISMHVGSQTQTLEIKCAKSEARISGQKADEFPPIPKISEGITTKVNPRSLMIAIGEVAFAAATDDSRPVLTGGYAHFSDDKLTLVTADGFRLAVHYLGLIEPVGEEVGVIIPVRALRELERLLKEQEEAVDITINPQRSQIVFRLKDVEIVSQLIQGSFPDYKQLIPQKYTVSKKGTRAEINVANFLQAVKTAAVFARDGSGIVKLMITPDGGIHISARAEEVGDSEGEIDAAIEGPETKIAFNSNYLMDIFDRLKDRPGSERVALEVTTPSSPGVFLPVSLFLCNTCKWDWRSSCHQKDHPNAMECKEYEKRHADEEEDWLQVVMPMFVQW